MLQHNPSHAMSLSQRRRFWTNPPVPPRNPFSLRTLLPILAALLWNLWSSLQKGQDLFSLLVCSAPCLSLRNFLLPDAPPCYEVCLLMGDALPCSYFYGLCLIWYYDSSDCRVRLSKLDIWSFYLRVCAVGCMCTWFFCYLPPVIYQTLSGKVI